MPNKPYLITAIIGNSKMLAAIDKRGELQRLWWPHIDYPQNIATFIAGFYYQDRIKWFQEDGWQHQQAYEEGMPILTTKGSDPETGLEVTCTDMVLPETDLLVRNYTIINQGATEVPLKGVLFSNWQVGNTQYHNTIMYHSNSRMLLHYHHGLYFGLGIKQPVDLVQCSNAMDALNHRSLNGLPIAMSGDAGLTADLGLLQPGQQKEWTFFIAAGNSPVQVEEIINAYREQPISQIKNQVREFWQARFKSCRRLVSGDAKINQIYRQSLLVFFLLSDKEGGGILAAPEFDEYYTRCGGYGYCWGRDGAYITVAMEKVGLAHLSERFFRWALRAQNPDGSWHQRHYVTGDLAPSWGLQVDETGSILWGLWQHYLSTQNRELLLEAFPQVQLAANFLINFTDAANGLPKICYDLWEERQGQHTYSAAAVFGGLSGASEIAKLLGQERAANSWRAAAERVRSAIYQHCWSAENHSFLRTLGPGNQKDVTPDASLLGLSIPFGVLPVTADQMKEQVRVLEEKLTIIKVGGLKRYESDHYVGGNPWIITTLWLALYYIKFGNLIKGKELFLWTAKHCTDLGFLPEQVDQVHGGPAWVVPLTWSHAMFILVLDALVENGVSF